MASVEISAQEVSDEWKSRYADAVADNVRLKLAFDRASTQLDEALAAVATLTATAERQTELLAEKDRYINELRDGLPVHVTVEDVEAEFDPINARYGEGVIEDVEPSPAPED